MVKRNLSKKSFKSNKEKNISFKISIMKYEKKFLKLLILSEQEKIF